MTAGTTEIVEIAADPGGDAVYLVGPNLATLEQRFGFDPIEFRTWVLVHELTHRAQFTGVPWMRAYFTGLVDELLGAVDPRPEVLFGRFALRSSDPTRPSSICVRASSPG